eukprot:s1459_g7.t1
MMLLDGIAGPQLVLRPDPLSPLPYGGYGTFVAQAACCERTGYATVVLDLNGLEGNRFACSLPAPVSDAELRAYISTIVGDEAEGFDLFVGEGQEPHPAGHPIGVTTGDMIYAAKAGRGPAKPQRCTYPELLADRATWGPADQFPRPLLKAGICLLYEDKRFFINRRQYPGQTPAEVAAHTVGLRTDASLLRSAQQPGLANVMLHGNSCKGVTCILNIRPPAPAGTGADTRDDNVCFFDLRPNGGQPIHHYQLGGTRHVHTVLASLGVKASEGYVLTCDVATRDGFATTAPGATVTVWPVPVGPTDEEDAADPPPSDDLEEDQESDSSANSDNSDDAEVDDPPPPPPRG